MSTETVKPTETDAGRLAALTMDPAAGRMFWKALIYAANRIPTEARVAHDDLSHEEWLRWGASRLDAAIRAAEAPADPWVCPKSPSGYHRWDVPIDEPEPLPADTCSHGCGRTHGELEADLAAKQPGGDVPVESAPAAEDEPRSPHRCPDCGEPTEYQRFSGGREFYCRRCDNHGMYEPGEAPPRLQMLADGKFDELRQEMRAEIARRKAGGAASVASADTTKGD